MCYNNTQGGYYYGKENDSKKDFITRRSCEKNQKNNRFLEGTKVANNISSVTRKSNLERISEKIWGISNTNKSFDFSLQ